MCVDDVDFNFKGNKDIYWICENENCNSSCIEQVRYGRSFKELWHNELTGVDEPIYVKN